MVTNEDFKLERGTAGDCCQKCCFSVGANDCEGIPEGIRSCTSGPKYFMPTTPQGIAYLAAVKLGVEV